MLNLVWHDDVLGVLDGDEAAEANVLDLFNLRHFLIKLEQNILRSQVTIKCANTGNVIQQFTNIEYQFSKLHLASFFAQNLIESCMVYRVSFD